MGKSAKPVDLVNSKMSKEERQARKAAEEKYQCTAKAVYKCPPELVTKREKQLYKSIVNLLKGSKILNYLDITILTSTVSCIIGMNDSMQFVREHGRILKDSNGKFCKNPALSDYKDSHTMYLANPTE